MTFPETLRLLFITDAKNLHAVEKQALSIMTPHIARIAFGRVSYSGDR